MAVSDLDSLISPYGLIRRDLAPPDMDVDESLKVWFAEAKLQADTLVAQKIYVEYKFYDYLYTTFIFSPSEESSLQRSYKFSSEQVKLITEFYSRVTRSYLLYFGDGTTTISKAYAGVKR